MDYTCFDLELVLAQFAHYASFSGSKEAIEQASWQHSFIAIQESLVLIKDALDYERLPGFSGLSNLDELIQRAQKKQVLSSEGLGQIRTCLAAIRTMKQVVNQGEHLLEMVETLQPLRPLYTAIDQVVDGHGAIRMEASPLLLQLQDERFQARADLTHVASEYIQRHQALLMEKNTFMSEGCLVVLVKTSEKNRLKGRLLGPSQSGSAWYFQPDAFFKHQQKIDQIDQAIEQEAYRLRKELTQQVEKEAKRLLSNVQTATLVDVAFAKAKWVIDHEGCLPHFSQQAGFRFLNARHPLLDHPVAQDLVVRDKACLMMTGPNMGGKSVCLKTIGLFYWLAHAGFPVLADFAALHFVPDLFVEMGDGQSIVDHLSTFSSHLTHLSAMLKTIQPGSLVVLDELGNGTDPNQGAYLAVALIEALLEKNCLVVVSTHFEPVKQFGLTDDRVLVASVGFDLDKMLPTYEVKLGVAGASYAFSLARHCDLPEEIVARAEYLMKQNEQILSKRLDQLSLSQQKIDQQKAKFDEVIANVHAMQRQVRQEKEAWDKEKESLKDQTEQELAEWLADQQAQAKQVIADLKVMQVAKPHELIQKLSELKPEPLRPEPSSLSKHEFKVGDYVKVTGLDSHGEIVQIRRKEAVINTNGTKLQIKLNRLEPMKRPNIEKKKVAVRYRQQTRFPLECNLIGMRTEEASQVLLDYLDQAVAHKAKQVRIVHGLGTGALRQAVAKLLDQHPQVKSSSLAEGMGATIVEL